MSIVLGGLALLAVGVGTGFGRSGTSRHELDHAMGDLSRSHREAFYLGDEVDGQRLAGIEQQSGIVYFHYGHCLDNDEGGCTRPLNVTSQPPRTWRNGGYVPGVPCHRLPPVRGVPAADIMGSLTVFTGSSMVSVISWRVVANGYVPDQRREASVISGLRVVGQTAPGKSLPPPDRETRDFVDQYCGQAPGDHGRLP